MARESDPSARIERHTAATLQRLVAHRIVPERHHLFAAVGRCDHYFEAETERRAGVVRPRLGNPRTKLRLEIFLEHVTRFYYVRVSVDKAVGVMHVSSFPDCAY